MPGSSATLHCHARPILESLPRAPRPEVAAAGPYRAAEWPRARAPLAAHLLLAFRKTPRVSAHAGCGPWRGPRWERSSRRDARTSTMDF